MNYFEKIVQRTEGETVPPLTPATYRKKAALPTDESWPVPEEKAPGVREKIAGEKKVDTVRNVTREKNIFLSEPTAEKKDFPPIIPDSNKAVQETNTQKIIHVEKDQMPSPDPVASHKTFPAELTPPAAEKEDLEKIIPREVESKEKKIQAKSIPPTTTMVPPGRGNPVTGRRHKEAPRVVIGKVVIELIQPPAPAPAKTVPAPVRKTPGHSAPAPGFRWEENLGRAGFGLDQF